jgi:hypothetical protein
LLLRKAIGLIELQEVLLGKGAALSLVEGAILVHIVLFPDLVNQLLNGFCCTHLRYILSQFVLCNLSIAVLVKLSKYFIELLLGKAVTLVKLNKIFLHEVATLSLIQSSILVGIILFPDFIDELLNGLSCTNLSNIFPDFILGNLSITVIVEISEDIIELLIRKANTLVEL